MDLFDVEKQLARGTFGMVYVCKKKHNQEKVVVKEIPFELLGVDFKKAENEVLILRCLNHPNIIKYLDSYHKNRAFYIVMEYASHGTLQQFIAKRRETKDYLLPQHVMDFFCQILLGLHHIHGRGIVHRDLKCENIFITGLKQEVLKIGDFGLSKLLANNCLANTVIGTCNYVAPEICEGKPYNKKSDIWALGCILYELCELDKMFKGPVSSVVLSIASGARKPINGRTYGKQMQELLNLCLQKNPADRPDTKVIMSLSDVFPTLFCLPTNLGSIF